MSIFENPIVLLKQKIDNLQGGNFYGPQNKQKNNIFICFFVRFMICFSLFNQLFQSTRPSFQDMQS